jgi:hypothetical protein
VVHKPLSAGLIEEIPADAELPVWRRDEDKAPWVNRDLPRAPLRLTRRSLRVARGSLLLTTETGSTVLDVRTEH